MYTLLVLAASAGTAHANIAASPQILVNALVNYPLPTPLPPW